MTIINLFIILLLVFLHQSYSISIIKNQFDFKTLKIVKPVITPNYDKWMVNFVLTDDNKYESCQIMPINRRIFISDAECIYTAVNKDHWAITIDFFHGSTRYADMAYVKDENIFYNSNFTSTYDPNERRIAILFADQPVFVDENKSLVTGSAQLAYEEVVGYNEANQIKRITYNFSDTDYSKCFMPIFNNTTVRVSCHWLNTTKTLCLYELTEYNLSQYNNLLNYLLCHTNRSQKKIALAGVLSKQNKPDVIINDRFVDLDFENVDDLFKSLEARIDKWFTEKYHQIVYPLY